MTFSLELSTMPSSLNCLNEYLAIDSGGNVGVYSSCSDYSMAECFPENSSWCRNEQVYQQAKCKVLQVVQRTRYWMHIAAEPPNDLKWYQWNFNAH